jgi:hypothetical protein
MGERDEFEHLRRLIEWTAERDSLVGSVRARTVAVQSALHTLTAADAAKVTMMASRHVSAGSCTPK